MVGGGVGFGVIAPSAVVVHADTHPRASSSLFARLAPRAALPPAPPYPARRCLPRPYLIQLFLRSPPPGHQSSFVLVFIRLFLLRHCGYCSLRA